VAAPLTGCRARGLGGPLAGERLGGRSDGQDAEVGVDDLDGAIELALQVEDVLAHVVRHERDHESVGTGPTGAPGAVHVVL
jgi:hypothetical protein